MPEDQWRDHFASKPKRTHPAASQPGITAHTRTTPDHANDPLHSYL